MAAIKVATELVLKSIPDAKLSRAWFTSADEIVATLGQEALKRHQPSWRVAFSVKRQHMDKDVVVVVNPESGAAYIFGTYPHE